MTEPTTTNFDLRRKPSLAASLALCVALLAAMAYLKLWVFRGVALPIGFGVPLVISSWTRDRRLVWGLAAGCAAIAVYRSFWLSTGLFANAADPAHSAYYQTYFGLIALADLVGVAAVVDVWIRSRETVARRSKQLQSRNAELAARREEAARVAEELQAQTEELERQSEELRASNEELAARQRTLESLLDLSRSLTTDLPRGDAMQRICELAAQLLGAGGAAVLERQGDTLRVTCGHGVHADGKGGQPIPFERSFAAIVIAHGRSGYLEDLALRPDLTVPAASDGPPVRSVLAAPLRLNRRTIGSLEVYAAERQGWTDEQVAILESLAAQLSSTLQSADLFEQADEQRRRLQTVLDTVPFGVAIANADCSEITFNPAAAAMFGVAPGAHRGLSSWPDRLTIYRDGQPIDPANYGIALACRGESMALRDLEVRFRDGRRLSLLSSAAPVRDRRGDVIGAVAAFADITAQKQLQHELDVRRRDAEEASVRKSRFLAAVSHDIRTPVNAISLLAELIQRLAPAPRSAADGGDGEEVGDLARELHGSAMSLVNLIGDVLDLTRLDTGRVDLQESDFDFGQLVAGEVRQLAPLAEQKNLLFECDAAAGVAVRTDRIKLARVVANLVGNAIKFTEKGGVHVAADLDPDGRPRLVVKDTGIGMAAEHLPRIFDEFFQLKNPERDKSKGSGLGLSICRRLVEVMGGNLDAQSEEGRGTTFTVRLPAAAVRHAPRG